MAETPNERLMWLEVIALAQRDAAGLGAAQRFQISWAKRWLTTGTRSFYAVCSLAGFDREKATYLKEQEQRKWQTKR